MTKKFLFALSAGFLLLPAISHTQVPAAEQEDALYNNTYLQNSRDSEDLNCDKENEACLTTLEVQLQALTELALGGSAENRKSVRKNAIKLRSETLRLEDDLQIYVLYREAGGGFDVEWDGRLRAEVNWANAIFNLSKKALYTINSYPKVFSSEYWLEIKNKLQNQYSADLEAFNNLGNPPVKSISPQVAVDLIQVEPEFNKYKSGVYKNRPRVYMFCRETRTYPCLMVMKNSHGQIETLADGTTPWTQPSLAYSRHKRPFNQASGNTPSGIFRIEGVMPNADQTMVFGKFRRLVLNFVAPTTDEQDQKYLLPPSSHNLSWWKEAVVARDMGRGLFRIHGTGLNSLSGTTYFPFVPTSGCVAKRENHYQSKTFKDQRLFLDELMTAAGVENKPENELQIRGLMYVININNDQRAVTLADLKNLGIL